MKKIVIALLCLLPTSAFASGKISVAPAYYTDAKKVGTTVGFSVYEKIFNPLALNFWTGVGQAYEYTDQSNWFTAKAGLDLYVHHKIIVTPGVQLSKDLDETGSDKSVNLKITYQLW